MTLVVHELHELHAGSVHVHVHVVRIKWCVKKCNTARSETKHLIRIVGVDGDRDR